MMIAEQRIQERAGERYGLIASSHPSAGQPIGGCCGSPVSFLVPEAASGSVELTRSATQTIPVAANAAGEVGDKDCCSDGCCGDDCRCC